MTEFCEDHRGHIQKISILLESHNIKFEPSADFKELLSKGKVVIASLIGDDSTILSSMLSNEIETNTAYQRMCDHPNIWLEARNFVNTALEDEKRHKAWLQKFE